MRSLLRRLALVAVTAVTTACITLHYAERPTDPIEDKALIEEAEANLALDVPHPSQPAGPETTSYMETIDLSRPALPAEESATLPVGPAVVHSVPVVAEAVEAEDAFDRIMRPCLDEEEIMATIVTAAAENLRRLR